MAAGEQLYLGGVEQMTEAAMQNRDLLRAQPLEEAQEEEDQVGLQILVLYTCTDHIHRRLVPTVLAL